MRTRSGHLVIAVLLLAMLAGVASLQYRWLGEVSSAERARLQASLHERASAFAQDTDRDITSAFAAFQVDPVAFDADAFKAVSDAAEKAAHDSMTGAAVKAIFVAEPGGNGGVRRFNKATHQLEPTEWPAELAGLGQRLSSAPALTVAGLPMPPGLTGAAIDADAPALIVPVTEPEPPLDTRPDQLFVRSVVPQAHWRAIVVWLDAERLRTLVVVPLVERHFADSATSEFNVALVSKRNGEVFYRSGAADVVPSAADLSSDVFALRLDELHWNRAVPVPRPGIGADAALVKDRVAITIVRRGSGDDVNDVSHSLGSGAVWTLLVQAKRGSLDAVVARSRMRNLAVSAGVLVVLGASLALILVALAREQRLARQQLEFVASVSHELRTPLAVIRSAGENLADGVVSGAQVAQYGALIRSEGRRLSDMVERVMDFAGMGAGTLIRSVRETNVRDLVDVAVSALTGEARDRGVEIHVRTAPDLPPVMVDPDALGSALRNGIGNAVKYSHPRSVVEVDVVAAAGLLRIAVSDRGIGIDTADLPHVFKPFYRGQRAVDSQVRGSGVGLSVVQKVVAAHGGDVRIASRAGGGTVLTIELPIATDRAPLEKA